MKCLHAITAILLIGSSQVYAQNATDTDVLLGATAGGVIGSTIGQGDGKKIATVIGALIGANMARDAAEARGGYPSAYNRTDPYFVKNRIRRHCERNVPREYAGYPEAARAWVEGCVQRQQMLQQELYNQAYEDGLNGTR